MDIGKVVTWIESVWNDAGQPAHIKSAELAAAVQTSAATLSSSPHSMAHLPHSQVTAAPGDAHRMCDEKPALRPGILPERVRRGLRPVRRERGHQMPRPAHAQVPTWPHPS